MTQKIPALLESLPVEDLLKIRERLDRIIKNKFAGKLGRRRSHRARVKVAATAHIEREKEFFFKTHPVTIHELSTGGLSFTTPAPVIGNDILSVSFRSPTSGEKKNIDCQALRVKEYRVNSGYEYEVAAKAVDREVVRAYRDMLKNRGRF
ncbi:MAG: PilZ domain-containing protein [Nitrospinaceae bacterium]